MEEQELAGRCRQGDNLARKELYERYAGRMLSVCLRYAGDRDTAEDLMHDGFLKLFDSFDKFTWRGDGSLRAWMERVMVNTALQYLRKNDVINQSEGLDNVPETYEEPDASTVETIPQKVLMQFISELPAGYRTVFNLYIFEEKSHNLIVLDLNLPGMDGMELLKELRKYNDETKVLILSARGQIADKVEGLDAGAND